MKNFVWPLLLAVAACADNQGTPLQIRASIVAAPPDCVFDAAALILRSGGRRDVSASSLGGFGYTLGLRLVNNAFGAVKNPLRFGAIENVYVDQNDVTLDGFNVCYEFKNFRVATEGVAAAPELTSPSCKDLAASSNEPSYFIPRALMIVANGENHVVSVDVMPPSITGVDLVTPFSQSSSRFLRNLANSGDTKTVIVHVQAVGHTNALVRMESNEFLFPVELCVGCVPFATACPGGLGGIPGNTGQIVDVSTFCSPGQDVVPGCVDP